MLRPICVAGLMMVVLTGCGTNSRLDIDDPEIEPVRRWLAENLDHPTWEEIVWYKPFHPAGGDVVACRIKVRTRSPSGGLHVVDKVLEVHGNNVVENSRFRPWLKEISVRKDR